MRDVVAAAAHFPAVLFTSALTVAAVFWLLVLLDRADLHAFDADAPSLARRLGGTPVSVAGTLAITSAWLITLAGRILLARTDLTGLGDAAARVALLALSVLVAGSLTDSLASPLAKLFSDGPGAPVSHGVASGAPFDPGSPRPRG